MDVYFESAMCKLFNVFPTQCTFFICLGSWVSVGSESLLTAYDGSCSILKPLREREVVLFPDLGAEDSWTTKMLTLRKHGIDCSISPLRGIASEEDVANGYDLADYLLKWSVEEFQS